MTAPYYEDEMVRLFHGDCREIAPSLDFDAIVTDPPYGIGYTPDGSMPRSRAYDSVIGDDEPFDPSWLIDLDVPSLLWGANHYASRLPDRPGWIAWRKRAFYVADVEFAWTNCEARPRMIEVEWRGATRGAETGLHYHPTQKPVRLMRECLLLSSIAARSVVLDPYGGSGTTLRAAIDLRRRAIGIELDERYCEIAAKRCAQASDRNLDESPLRRLAAYRTGAR